MSIEVYFSKQRVMPAPNFWQEGETPSLNVCSSSHSFRFTDNSFIYAIIAGPPKAVKPNLRKDRNNFPFEIFIGACFNYSSVQAVFSNTRALHIDRAKATFFLTLYLSLTSLSDADSSNPRTCRAFVISSYFPMDTLKKYYRHHQ